MTEPTLHGWAVEGAKADAIRAEMEQDRVRPLRLAACGDLHLGSGLRFTENRLDEQRQVWETILVDAVQKGAEWMLVPGDVFDRSRPTPQEYLAFVEPIMAVQLPVLVIPGNHDVWAAELPSAVDVTDALGTELVKVIAHPGWLDMGRFALATLPWVPPHRMIAARDGGDRDDLNLEIAELLVAEARRLFDLAKNEGPRVLMLHWSVAGAKLTDPRASTEFLREPVLPRHELLSIGYDLIVAGHIHRGQSLELDPDLDTCNALYTGTPYPLGFGDDEQPHGWWLWINDGKGAVHYPVESRRFLTVGDNDTLTDELVHDAVVRVKYESTRSERKDERMIRDMLLRAGAHRVFVQWTPVKETRSRVAVDEELSAMEQLETWLGASHTPETDAERLRALTHELLGEEE